MNLSNLSKSDLNENRRKKVAPAKRGLAQCAFSGLIRPLRRVFASCGDLSICLLSTRPLFRPCPASIFSCGGICWRCRAVKWPRIRLVKYSGSFTWACQPGFLRKMSELLKVRSDLSCTKAQKIYPFLKKMSDLSKIWFHVVRLNKGCLYYCQNKITVSYAGIDAACTCRLSESWGAYWIKSVVAAVQRRLST